MKILKAAFFAIAVMCFVSVSASADIQSYFGDFAITGGDCGWLNPNSQDRVRVEPVFEPGITPKRMRAIRLVWYRADLRYFFESTDAFLRAVPGAYVAWGTEGWTLEEGADSVTIEMNAPSIRSRVLYRFARGPYNRIILSAHKSLNEVITDDVACVLAPQQ